MGGDDWYRNKRWNAEIAAEFDRRLARARTQKAQYLRIQGSTLKDTDPAAAIALLQRCVAQGDEAFVAAAYLDLAHARYVSKDVDGALDALKAAVEQQRRAPRFRTTAAIDFAFLVAIHGRVEHFDEAVALLDEAGEGPFADIEFEAAAARALICDAQGQCVEAQRAAKQALAAASIREGWVPGFPQVGIVPQGETPLRDRLRRIASDPQG